MTTRGEKRLGPTDAVDIGNSQYFLGSNGAIMALEIGLLKTGDEKEARILMGTILLVGITSALLAI